MTLSDLDKFTFTREEFYERIWHSPATKLAKELGCSDVMIGKVCKAYNIPKPYSGYWAQLEFGKNPKKTPLPNDDNPEIQALTFHRHAEGETTITEPEPEPQYDTDICELIEKAQALPPIEVLTTLIKPHPLVAATRAYLKIQQIPYHRRTSEQIEVSRPCLAIEVSEGSTNRALCIMDAIIKRVEKIGGTVEVKKERNQEWKKTTVVCLGGEDVATIRIREKRNMVRIAKDKKRNSWDPDTELQPSGKLILDRGPSSWDSVLLSDLSKRGQIEKGLNDLIIAFIECAGMTRINRRKEAVERRRQEEEESIRRQQQEELRRRREEIVKKQEEEQAKVDRLMLEAKNWGRSRLIRKYLGAVCDMLLDRNGAIDIGSQAAEFLRWGYWQADRLDPLKPSPTSVLDERF